MLDIGSYVYAIIIIILCTWFISGRIITYATNIVESNMFFSLIQSDGGQDGGETASNATENTYHM